MITTAEVVELEGSRTPGGMGWDETKQQILDEIQSFEQRGVPAGVLYAKFLFMGLQSFNAALFELKRDKRIVVRDQLINIAE